MKEKRAKREMKRANREMKRDRRSGIVAVGEIAGIV